MAELLRSDVWTALPRSWQRQMSHTDFMAGSCFTERTSRHFILSVLRTQYMVINENVSHILLKFPVV